MTNKEIKERLMKPDQIFIIKGKVDYMGNPKKFITYSSEKNYTTRICDDAVFGDGMNVKKWGSKMVFLYTFDMMKTQTTATIRYEDIKFI